MTEKVITSYGVFCEKLGDSDSKKLLAEFNSDDDAFEYLANICFMDYDYYIAEKGYFKGADANENEIVKHFDWVRNLTT